MILVARIALHTSGVYGYKSVTKEALERFTLLKVSRRVSNTKKVRIILGRGPSEKRCINQDSPSVGQISTCKGGEATLLL